MNETERIDNLEIKVTYLEDVIEKLNDALLSQNESILELNREIKLLKENKMESDIRPDERPPHY